MRQKLVRNGAARIEEHGVALRLSHRRRHATVGRIVGGARLSQNRVDRRFVLPQRTRAVCSARHGLQSSMRAALLRTSFWRIRKL